MFTKEERYKIGLAVIAAREANTSEVDAAAECAVHLVTARDDMQRLRRDAEQGREVVRIATERGWNGAESSKILSVFIESELDDLARRRNPRCQREECKREQDRVDVLAERLTNAQAAYDKAAEDLGRTRAERDALQRRVSDLKMALGDGAGWFDRFKGMQKERDKVTAELATVRADRDRYFSQAESAVEKAHGLLIERDDANRRLAQLRDLIVRGSALAVEMATAAGEPPKQEKAP